MSKVISVALSNSGLSTTIIFRYLAILPHSSSTTQHSFLPSHSVFKCLPMLPWYAGTPVQPWYPTMVPFIQSHCSSFPSLCLAGVYTLSVLLWFSCHVACLSCEDLSSTLLHSSLLSSKQPILFFRIFCPSLLLFFPTMPFLLYAVLSYHVILLCTFSHRIIIIVCHDALPSFLSCCYSYLTVKLINSVSLKLIS